MVRNPDQLTKHLDHNHLTMGMMQWPELWRPVVSPFVQCCHKFTWLLDKWLLTKKHLHKVVVKLGALCSVPFFWCKLLLKSILKMKLYLSDCTGVLKSISNRFANVSCAQLAKEKYLQVD